MEESRFDTLLRKTAQQTTRRETLGALIGGALLLNHREESEATKEAERRKKRRKQRRRRAIPEPRSHRVQVWNPEGNPEINYSKGWSSLFQCCKYSEDGKVFPGGRITNGGLPWESSWLWIDDGKYWFEFYNPVVGQPYIEIAVNGRYRPSSNCCRVIPYGQTVEGRLSFAKNQARDVNIAGKIFRIQRRPDTELDIRFEMYLPQNIHG